ncbi:MAG: SRPBCC family protein [Bacteroidota bacterium]
MEFKREIIIDRPVATVWNTLGNQFGEAYKWASGINHSESFGAPKLKEAHCNNRACELPSGKIKEVIRKFDPNNFELEYEVIEGFPSFVESGINNWKLTNLNGKTKVDMHLVIKTKGILGSIMGPMMKMQMNGLTKSVLNDLKHYVETGKPSPLKQKEMQKLARKAVAA